MFEANAKLSTGILKDCGLGVFFAIFPKKLNLSTNTVVLKQGKLQHAAVYDIKFRMKLTKTEYLMTYIMQFQSKHPSVNDLVHTAIYPT